MEPELLASLVTSACTAGSADRGALSRLADGCWPASADGTVPAARDWVRRWGPRPVAPSARACGCAAGRCGVCN